MQIFWVASSVAERCSDKAEVVGSIPTPPTKMKKNFWALSSVVERRICNAEVGSSSLPGSTKDKGRLKNDSLKLWSNI